MFDYLNFESWTFDWANSKATTVFHQDDGLIAMKTWAEEESRKYLRKVGEWEQNELVMEVINLWLNEQRMYGHI